MTDPLKFKFDGTVNLAMLAALVGIIITGTVWVTSVNNRLDQVTTLLAAEDNNRRDIDVIRADLEEIKEASLDNNRRLGGRVGDE